MKKIRQYFRWLFKRCMDCGVKLEKHPLSARGDVCQKCFDDFNGLTIEEIIGDESGTSRMNTIPVEKRDEMFGIICEMSDRQVEPIVKTRLKAMMRKPNEEIKDELLGLIDDIAYCSWTSDFEIRILNNIWHATGGTEEELRLRNLTISEDMRNPEKKKALQAKYKWQAARQHE